MDAWIYVTNFSLNLFAWGKLEREMGGCKTTSLVLCEFKGHVRHHNSGIKWVN